MYLFLEIQNNTYSIFETWRQIKFLIEEKNVNKRICVVDVYGIGWFDKGSTTYQVKLWKVYRMGTGS